MKRAGDTEEGVGMFSWMRKRATYANVVMTFALVFAMSGGAYAAKRFLITSTKQISPSVLKQLKGKNGLNGANGVPGAQGPQGPAGANGKDGVNGTNGKDGLAGAAGETGPAGPAGAKGAAGPAGPTGPAGSPWTGNGTLPAGATEAGAWAMGDGNSGVGLVLDQTAISFTIPLGAALDEEHVQFNVLGYDGTDGSGTAHEQCPGTAAAPKAKAGFLCVYMGSFANLVNSSLIISQASTEFAKGADAVGAKLIGFPETSEASASGTWAVTG